VNVIGVFFLPVEWSYHSSCGVCKGRSAGKSLLPEF